MLQRDFPFCLGGKIFTTPPTHLFFRRWMLTTTANRLSRIRCDTRSLLERYAFTLVVTSSPYTVCGWSFTDANGNMKRVSSYFLLFSFPLIIVLPRLLIFVVKKRYLNKARTSFKQKSPIFENMVATY